MQHFSLHVQIQRAEQAYSSAAAQVARARTMREAVQAGHVAVPPELRALRHTSVAYRRLQAGLTARLRALLEEQLEQARQVDDTEARKQLLARWYLNDWQFLRGPHAALFREAETARLKLLSRP